MNRPKSLEELYMPKFRRGHIFLFSDIHVVEATISGKLYI